MPYGHGPACACLTLVSIDRPSSPAILADECHQAPAIQNPRNEDAPLTGFQRQLIAGSGGISVTEVARFWEETLWGDFQMDCLQRAATGVEEQHPLARAMLDAKNSALRLDAAPAEPLVRVTDGRGMAEADLRRVLRIERERLCLDDRGALARAWQIHVLLTDSHSAWVTAGFARVIFDRASTRGILRDLHAAYHGGGLPERARSGDAFRSFAQRASARGPAAGMESDASPAGPELPMLTQGEKTGNASTSWIRTTRRVKAETWARIRGHFEPAHPLLSSEAILSAALVSTIAHWSRTARFSVQVACDSRPLHRVDADAPGQFTMGCVLEIDEASERAFTERAQAIHQQLVSTLRGSVSTPGHPALPTPGISVTFSSRAARRPQVPAGDEFVFVGASRPGVVLEIHVEETSEGALHLHWDRPGLVFADDVIEELAASSEQWLHTLVNEEAWLLTPSRQGWKLLPPNQARRRSEVNATAAPAPDELLHAAFLRRVQEQGDATAVVTRARTLTYTELYGYACALAHVLASHRVRTNELVAIAATKGWEQIAAALGVTMAGAAYLPIDMELPPERIKFLIEHGDVRCVITQADRVASLPSLDGVEIIALDQLVPATPEQPLPAHATGPGDLAYVIFTSGSTGTPKGVMIEHRGAANTLHDLNHRYHLRSSDRVLALSRLGFDLSVYDIFGVLGAGGAIVVPEPDMTRDPAHWFDLVQEHRVTLWNTVPALMNLLVDYVEEAGRSLGGHLRLVWMSGDWIPLSLPDRIRRLAPAAQVISMGGATEASVWSILYPIEHVDPSWRSIPYGKPMVNQTFHVLRENLSPAPDLVTGELYIGGIGVARGYWKDPEKTAARFVQHPVTGERLYRTGDLGRYLPDGNIEFLGRADFQVKIRGFRIELGEIEAVLCSDPRVRAAVVVARGDSDASRHLVGYVVPRDEANIPASELQQRLRAQLPEYMVPPVIMELPRLPLTANGKVDVKALPSPDPRAGIARPPPAAPTNEIEEILLDLWREILGVREIGIHDDFFMLGGNSLSGTRMIIRLRAAFSLQLPVQALFQNSTIHRLAGVLEQALLQDVGQETPPA